MKSPRALFLIAMFFLCAGVASADGVRPDPQVILGGAGRSTQILGNTFSFTIDGNGGGVFDFIAPKGGEDIFVLALTFTAPTTDLSAYTCGTGGLFATCGATLNGNGTVTVLFSGASEDEPEWLDDLAELCNAIAGKPIFDSNDINGGIEEGQHFSIDLGASGWLAGTTVTGVLNPVPEPGTMALLLAGLGFAAVGRKFRRA